MEVVSFFEELFFDTLFSNDDSYLIKVYHWHQHLTVLVEELRDVYLRFLLQNKNCRLKSNHHLLQFLRHNYLVVAEHYYEKHGILL
ncbi:hypothetical protein D3C84_490470 [compost metagenome]